MEQLLQFPCSCLGGGLSSSIHTLSLVDPHNNREVTLVIRGCTGQSEWLSFFWMQYAFIPGLCSVKTLSVMTKFFTLFRVARFFIHSCWTLPAVEIVANRLVVDFHESQCSKSVAKLYIILTASDFSWQNNLQQRRIVFAAKDRIR